MDLYADIAELGAASPAAVQALAELFTDGVLGVFAVLFAVAGWRAWHRGSPADRARALLAPAVTVVAYVASEAVKTLWREDRPCRGGVDTIAPCPEIGDWSFPSNHATIAGAAATALLLIYRRIGVLAAVVAVLAAFSRVFVGVHYPHDVLAGLLLGVLVAVVLVPALTRPLTRPLARLRPNRPVTIPTSQASRYAAAPRSRR
jgi:membrane-associated phospholipid phosphatase